MICVIFYPNYDEIRRVCTNFVRLVETRLEMYAGSVRWPLPASMSADWYLRPWTDAGANLRVSVGDA